MRRVRFALPCARRLQVADSTRRPAQRLEQFNWYLTSRLHTAANAASAAAAAAAAAAGEEASPLGVVEEREREVLQHLDVAR